MNNQPTSFQQPSVAIRNYSFLVFYLVVLSALGSFVNDMYAPALPSMARLFGCSVSTAQMGLTMGMIGLALGQLILGPVSDRVGRKPVLVGSMAALRFKLLKNAGVVGAWMLVVVMTATCVSLWLVKNFWVYELLMLPMMVALGMIFTMSNTLAMNEGRSSAGEASAVLGVSGYVFGAIVAPLVGVGDMLHSTAIVYAVLTVILIVAAEASRRLPADLGK